MRHVATICAIAAGCAMNSESTRVKMVTDRAAFDLSCEASKLRVVKISETSYGAIGCGARATYLLNRCDSANSWQKDCQVSLDAVKPADGTPHPASSTSAATSVSSDAGPP